ncbi:MAG TPA: SAM-dependent methyltransferase [Candidatus Acidoferrum sp.]|nr:SAM-dependent methyltransferase [Candidatus Acidoferrum sp.]
MSSAPAVVRHISDTAWWAAYFRAAESRRPDAMFRDPYAEKLGAREGAEMARTLPEGENHAWAWVARTYLFDEMLQKEIADGADLIVNCAAGLDARPYRMQLPPALTWVEADLPDILAYKAERLAPDKPTCHLERVAVNLADVAERRNFFAQLAKRGKRGVVLTEGLLIYLSPEGVAQLAKDLSDVAPLQRWILDIHSPQLLSMMQKRTGKALEKVGAPFLFGPAEGPEFFTTLGWKPARVEGLLSTAARFGRPPFILRLVAKLFDARKFQPKRPWAGVCLLQKNLTAQNETRS